MLRWAFGYLAMAVVVAIGFGSLQGTEPPERRVAAAAAEHSVASARRARAEHLEAEDEADLEDGGLGYGSDPGDESDWEEQEDLEDVVAPDDDSDWEDQDDLEYVVEANPGGHYVIEASVNGAPVTFLVDTGASDIVLTQGDARRIGLQPSALEYTQRFATANGEVRGAPVVLRELRIGQLRLFDVEASVNKAPLGISLLGMDFLEQLSSYEVERGRLILRW
jgi:clan AA aspartic protease (TIGR02281 family)